MSWMFHAGQTALMQWHYSIGLSMSKSWPLTIKPRTHDVTRICTTSSVSVVITCPLMITSVNCFYSSNDFVKNIKFFYIAFRLLLRWNVKLWSKTSGTCEKHLQNKLGRLRILRWLNGLQRLLVNIIKKHLDVRSMLTKFVAKTNW